eukprot:scaffold6179_cov188-Prasinococcus_capsulatus_cf.AAC.1
MPPAPMRACAARPARQAPQAQLRLGGTRLLQPRRAHLRPRLAGRSVAPARCGGADGDQVPADEQRGSAPRAAPSTPTVVLVGGGGRVGLSTAQALLEYVPAAPQQPGTRAQAAACTSDTTHCAVPPGSGPRGRGCSCDGRRGGDGWLRCCSLTPPPALAAAAARRRVPQAEVVLVGRS